MAATNNAASAAPRRVASKKEAARRAVAASLSGDDRRDLGVLLTAVVSDDLTVSPAEKVRRHKAPLAASNEHSLRWWRRTPLRAVLYPWM